jgi:protein gp37
MAKQNSGGISWTDETCSPIVGCNPTGPECLNCWAVATAHRLAGNPNPKLKAAYGALTRKDPAGKPEWTGIVRCLPERLRALLHSRGSGRLFLPSMGDPFHDEVPDEFLDMLFATVALCSKRIFQILTKRPKRAYQYLLDPIRWALVEGMAQKLYSELHPEDKTIEWWLAVCEIPKNIDLIFSAGTQKTLAFGIDDFLACPGRKGLSLEPLLEPINLDRWLWIHDDDYASGRRMPVGGWDRPQPISWIIVGPETGPKRRHCETSHIRSIVQQASAACIPVHVKAIEINGRISKDMSEWPEDLRIREFPETK